MSTVTVSPDRVFEAILKATLRKEHELARIEQVIVKKYRKWWNSWLYKGCTDEDIIDNSFHYGMQRCSIMADIEKLTALINMCIHAIQEGTTITLCRKDYELIYGEIK